MRLALVGDPVAHSLSPTIHAAALAHARIPGTYEALQVDGPGLEGVIADLRNGGFDGLNVTMPHKQQAYRLCDELEPEADRAGAVNTLVRVGKAIVGHNTDIAGIRDAWRKGGLPPSPVLVLGNGGAAAAAYLAATGVDVFVTSRREGAAGRLADRLGISATEVPWAEAVPGAVVVNATPLGMGDESLPSQLIEGAAGLFDMAYGHEPTQAVTAARDAGLPTVDGTDMLIAQAAQAFRLWTGRRAGVSAMRRALNAKIR